MVGMTELVMANLTNASSYLEGNWSEGSTAPQDYHSVLLFQYYVWGIAGNVVSVLGIIGNMLSIVVLANQRMMSSTSCYLIALAIFDSIVLLALVLFLALPTFYLAKGLLTDYYYAYPYMHPYAYPVALIAQTCSIYTTVAFTVERYIAVCRPLKAAKLCTISHARKAIMAIVTCSVIYNIPRMLEYKVEEKFDSDLNQTTARFVHTALGKNPTFQHIYFIYMHIAFMLLIPFTTLAVLNICLIRAVKQSEGTRGKVNKKIHRENSLTVMLISVVIVFLVCQVPSIVDNIFHAVLNSAIDYEPAYVKLTSVSNLMVIINSATNFYIYCLFGNKFRRVCCRVFCMWYLRATQSGLTSDSSLYNASMRGPHRTSNFCRNSKHESARSKTEPRWNKLQMSVYENGKTRSYCAAPTEANGKYHMMEDQTHL